MIRWNKGSKNYRYVVKDSEKEGKDPGRPDHRRQEARAAVGSQRFSTTATSHTAGYGASARTYEPPTRTPVAGTVPRDIRPTGGRWTTTGVVAGASVGAEAGSWRDTSKQHGGMGRGRSPATGIASGQGHYRTGRDFRTGPNVLATTPGRSAYQPRTRTASPMRSTGDMAGGQGHYRTTRTDVFTTGPGHSAYQPRARTASPMRSTADNRSRTSQFSQSPIGTTSDNRRGTSQVGQGDKMEGDFVLVPGEMEEMKHGRYGNFIRSTTPAHRVGAQEKPTPSDVYSKSQNIPSTVYPRSQNIPSAVPSEVQKSKSTDVLPQTGREAGITQPDSSTQPSHVAIATVEDRPKGAASAEVPLGTTTSLTESITEGYVVVPKASDQESQGEDSPSAGDTVDVGAKDEVKGEETKDPTSPHKRSWDEAIGPEDDVEEGTPELTTEEEVSTVPDKDQGYVDVPKVSEQESQREDSPSAGDSTVDVGVKDEVKETKEPSGPQKRRWDEAIGDKGKEGTQEPQTEEVSTVPDTIPSQAKATIVTPSPPPTKVKIRRTASEEAPVQVDLPPAERVERPVEPSESLISKDIFKKNQHQVRALETEELPEETCQTISPEPEKPPMPEDVLKVKPKASVVPPVHPPNIKATTTVSSGTGSQLPPTVSYQKEEDIAGEKPPAHSQVATPSATLPSSSQPTVSFVDDEPVEESVQPFPSKAKATVVPQDPSPTKVKVTRKSSLESKPLPEFQTIDRVEREVNPPEPLIKTDPLLKNQQQVRVQTTDEEEETIQTFGPSGGKPDRPTDAVPSRAKASVVVPPTCPGVAASVTPSAEESQEPRHPPHVHDDKQSGEQRPYEGSAYPPVLPPAGGVPFGDDTTGKPGSTLPYPSSDRPTMPTVPQPLPEGAQLHAPPEGLISSPWQYNLGVGQPGHPSYPPGAPYAPYPPGPATDAPYPPGQATEAPYSPGPATKAPYPSGPATKAPYPPGPATGAPYPPGPTTGTPYPPGPATKAPYPPGPATGAPYPPGPATGAPYPPGPATGAPYPPGPATGVPYMYPPGPATGVPYPPGPATGVPYPPGPATKAPYPPFPGTKAPYPPGPATKAPYPPGPATEVLYPSGQAPPASPSPSPFYTPPAPAFPYPGYPPQEAPGQEQPLPGSPPHPAYPTRHDPAFPPHLPQGPYPPVPSVYPQQAPYYPHPPSETPDNLPYPPQLSTQHPGQPPQTSQLGPERSSGESQPDVVHPSAPLRPHPPIGFDLVSPPGPPVGQPPDQEASPVRETDILSPPPDQSQALGGNVPDLTTGDVSKPDDRLPSDKIEERSSETQHSAKDSKDPGPMSPPDKAVLPWRPVEEIISPRPGSIAIPLPWTPTPSPEKQQAFDFAGASRRHVTVQEETVEEDSDHHQQKQQPTTTLISDTERGPLSTSYTFSDQEMPTETEKITAKETQDQSSQSDKSEQPAGSVKAEEEEYDTGVVPPGYEAADKERAPQSQIPTPIGERKPQEGQDTARGYASQGRGPKELKYSASDKAPPGLPVDQQPDQYVSEIHETDILSPPYTSDQRKPFGENVPDSTQATDDASKPDDHLSSDELEKRRVSFETQHSKDIQNSAPMSPPDKAVLPWRPVEEIISPRPGSIAIPLPWTPTPSPEKQKSFDFAGASRRHVPVTEEVTEQDSDRQTKQPTTTVISDAETGALSTSYTLSEQNMPTESEQTPTEVSEEDRSKISGQPGFTEAEEGYQSGVVPSGYGTSSSKENAPSSKGKEDTSQSRDQDSEGPSSPEVEPLSPQKPTSPTKTGSKDQQQRTTATSTPDKAVLPWEPLENIISPRPGSIAIPLPWTPTASPSKQKLFEFGGATRKHVSVTEEVVVQTSDHRRKIPTTTLISDTETGSLCTSYTLSDQEVPTDATEEAEDQSTRPTQPGFVKADEEYKQGVVPSGYDTYDKPQETQSTADDDASESKAQDLDDPSSPEVEPLSPHKPARPTQMAVTKETERSPKTKFFPRKSEGSSDGLSSSEVEPVTPDSPMSPPYKAVVVWRSREEILSPRISSVVIPLPWSPLPSSPTRVRQLNKQKATKREQGLVEGTTIFEEDPSMTKLANVVDIPQREEVVLSTAFVPSQPPDHGDVDNELNKQRAAADEQVFVEEATSFEADPSLTQVANVAGVSPHEDIALASSFVSSQPPQHRDGDREGDVFYDAPGTTEWEQQGKQKPARPSKIPTFQAKSPPHSTKPTESSAQEQSPDQPQPEDSPDSFQQPASPSRIPRIPSKLPTSPTRRADSPPPPSRTPKSPTRKTTSLSKIPTAAKPSGIPTKIPTEDSESTAGAAFPPDDEKAATEVSEVPQTKEQEQEPRTGDEEEKQDVQTVRSDKDHAVAKPQRTDQLREDHEDPNTEEDQKKELEDERERYEIPEDLEPIDEGDESSKDEQGYSGDDDTESEKLNTKFRGRVLKKRSSKEDLLAADEEDKEFEEDVKAAASQRRAPPKTLSLDTSRTPTRRQQTYPWPSPMSPADKALLLWKPREDVLSPKPGSIVIPLPWSPTRQLPSPMTPKSRRRFHPPLRQLQKVLKENTLDVGPQPTPSYLGVSIIPVTTHYIVTEFVFSEDSRSSEEPSPAEVHELSGHSGEEDSWVMVEGSDDDMADMGAAGYTGHEQDDDSFCDPPLSSEEQAAVKRAVHNTVEEFFGEGEEEDFY